MLAEVYCPSGPPNMMSDRKACPTELKMASYVHSKHSERTPSSMAQLVQGLGLTDISRNDVQNRPQGLKLQLPRSHRNYICNWLASAQATCPQKAWVVLKFCDFEHVWMSPDQFGFWLPYTSIRFLHVSQCLASVFGTVQSAPWLSDSAQRSYLSHGMPNLINPPYVHTSFSFKLGS